MLRLSFALLLILFSFYATGQIKGKIFNRDHQALEFVTVLLKEDSVKIFTTISNHRGEFNVSNHNLKPNGKYHLVLSLVGYKTVDTTVLGNQPMQIMTEMSVQNNQLKGVMVISKKNILERKVDRLIFNVENNLNTVGLNALDILAKTPMVRIENESITLTGKESVSVMVDNRIVHLSGQELSNLLKAIGGENVSKIEVITNPSAQYEAAGNSGMINIVTKKNRLPGFSGSVSSNLSRSTYTYLGEALNLNYAFRKILLFGSINSGHGANRPTNFNSRFYQNQTWEQSIKNKESSNYWGETLGFEYLASSKTMLGASLYHSISRPNTEGTSNTSIINKSSNAIDSILTAPYNDSKLFKNTTLNMHWSQKLDSNKTSLNFDIDYFNSTSDIQYKNTNQNLFADGTPTSPATLVQSRNNLGSHGLTFNAEINAKFRKSSLSFGGKASFLNSNSDVFFFKDIDKGVQIDTATLNQFDFNENIQALFASFQTSFGDFQLQAGLRAEGTQTKGLSQSLNQTNRNSYFALFPTFYLTYSLGKKDALSFSYGRRIGRPNFSSFNPFRIYYNQYDYSTGNPFLKPSYSDNFEISNTYDQVLNTTLSYNINSSLPSTIQIIDNGSNASIGTIGNFNSSRSLSLDNSISLNPVKWIESSYSVSVYYIKTHSTSPYKLSELAGFGGDASASNSFYVNKERTLVTGIDFMYQFPYTSGLTHAKKNYRVDISGRYSLFEKRLQVSVEIRDIFKTRTSTLSTLTNGIESISSANNDSRRAVIGLRYNFGNSKQRKGQQHNVSSQEQGQAGG